MDDHIKTNASPNAPKDVDEDKPADCMQNAENQTITPHSYVDITAMIRSLQRTEGFTDCFRRGLFDCDQLDCAWRQYCLTKSDSMSTKTDPET
jgi:hypothetical protein